MTSPVLREKTIGDCRLILGDCLEVMPFLDPVDHVITDPPYEQISQDRIGGIKRNDGGSVTDGLTFAGIDKIRSRVCGELPRVSQGWCILFCTAEGVAPWRDGLETVQLKYKTPMIWVKPDAMPKFNGQGPALGYENIITAWAGRGHSCWNAGGKRGVYTALTNDRNRHGVHPTEKPIPLMSALIRDFTKPEQTILDPFMGSGTTGVACAKMGRKFIGVGLERKYFDIACQRIEEAYRQPDIFVEAERSKPVQTDMLKGAA